MGRQRLYGLIERRRNELATNLLEAKRYVIISANRREGVSSLLGFGLSSIISTAFAAARRFPAATTHAVLTIQRNPFSTTSVIPQLATTRAAAGKRFDLTRGKTKRSEDECMKISFSRHLLYPPIVDEGLRVSRSRRHVVVVVVVVSFFVV